MKTLILTVGLPRSGKTTWAMKQAAPAVNPDSIRLALHGQKFAAEAEPFVWAIARVMVKALFLAGRKVVILDATNVTAKRRDEWISPDWQCVFKEFDTPLGECLTRADGDPEILAAIRRMHVAREPLGPNRMTLEEWWQKGDTT